MDVAVAGALHNLLPCAGGALWLHSVSQQDPFASNVTISRTTFADNHAVLGDDIDIYRDINLGAVPCPAPGKAWKSAGEKFKAEREKMKQAQAKIGK